MVHDLKFVFRQLRKSPGFSAMAIVMLALGIGATTAIFSIVEGVLLRPLPFPEPTRLVVLADHLQGTDFGGNGESGVTGPDIVAYTRDTHSFSSLGGYQQTGYELSGKGEPEVLSAARLGSGVFPALRVAPLLGRTFTQQEDQRHERVVVLSYELWQSRFHGDAGVVGSTIQLDRNPYVVIGVMPRGFEFPLVPGQLNQSQLWVPLSLQPDEVGNGGQASWNFQMVGRLLPGVSPAQAQQDAERVAEQTMRGYPAFMSSLHISALVHSLQEDTVAAARPMVRTLFLAVVVVLLIACANLAGLLLVRAIRKRREIAVRLALGAQAPAILRQTVLESLVLSTAGGALGLLLAGVALRVGTGLLPETLPRVQGIGLDWQVVAFALLISAATGVLCGLAPAFAAMRTRVNDALKEGGRTGSAGSGHARLRSALVIAEVAVALVLLTASGLLLRSFEKMREVNPGFRPDHTVAASYGLPEKQYTTQAQVDAFSKELLRRLQELPGYQAAGLTTLLPATGSNSNSAFVVDGYVQPKGSPLNLGWPSQVMGDYFQAMGIPLLRGRFFTEADKAGSQLVVIVNQKVAERFWPGQDPIGKRLRWGMQETPTPWMTVVGEVGNVKQGSPDQDTSDQLYQPVSQMVASFGTFVSSSMLSGNSGNIALRSALPPEQMENALRSVVHAIDPQLALSQVQTMEHAISDSEAPRRFNTALISAFAAAAVLLAILGIYSVIAFSAALRTQEMAIRMALGSQRSGVLGLVLVSGMKLAGVGCAIGLLGAVAAAHLLRSFLFELSPFDPLVLSLAAASVLLLSIAASLLPARRAASIDPMRALRSE
ncbi:ABC transporter permease [Paracidobacterium acidisoli]|uniref:ABC transporter permease n=1 Tax=Paracidobacterium acidisoli TaxID=2303751 RepID=A0A372IS97_9BACT|nr:ABC transporter permease [Paracidobacterium acidisoli]MBT9330726.1 ABC transporter permease [Paracidobacterium acidisoli]